MNAYADQNLENKVKTAADNPTRQQSAQKSDVYLTDNRPGSVMQQKQQNMINTHPRVAQLVAGDSDRVIALDGKYITFKVDGLTKSGKVAVDPDGKVTIGGIAYSKLKLDGMRFMFVRETGAPKTAEKKMSVTEQHLGGFDEHFHHGESGGSGLREVVSGIAARTAGVGVNFACDEFARNLQHQLQQRGVPFRSLLIAVDVAPDPRNETHIVLHEEGHKFNNQAVGNDSHFVTTIEEGGIIWVFDNHHPQGILLANFLSSMEFRANIHGVPPISHAELVNRGLIKVFLMPAEVAGKASGWLKALMESNPRFNKIYGLLMRDFMERYQRMGSTHIKKLYEGMESWDQSALPKDGQYDASVLSDDEILAMIDQALISGRKWAVEMVLRHNFNREAILATARSYDMRFRIAGGEVFYLLRGG